MKLQMASLIHSYQVDSKSQGIYTNEGGWFLSVCLFVCLRKG